MPKKYDPVDDNASSGYRRPSNDPAEVVEYFHALGYIEDNGRFARAEMAELLSDPQRFFGVPDTGMYAALQNCLTK